MYITYVVFILYVIFCYISSQAAAWKPPLLNSFPPRDSGHVPPTPDGFVRAD